MSGALAALSGAVGGLFWGQKKLLSEAQELKLSEEQNNYLSRNIQQIEKLIKGGITPQQMVGVLKASSAMRSIFVETEVLQLVTKHHVSLPLLLSIKDEKLLRLLSNHVEDVEALLKQGVKLDALVKIKDFQKQSEIITNGKALSRLLEKGLPWKTLLSFKDIPRVLNGEFDADLDQTIRDAFIEVRNFTEEKQRESFERVIGIFRSVVIKHLEVFDQTEVDELVEEGMVPKSENPVGVAKKGLQEAKQKLQEVEVAERKAKQNLRNLANGTGDRVQKKRRVLRKTEEYVQVNKSEIVSTRTADERVQEAERKLEIADDDFKQPKKSVKAVFNEAGLAKHVLQEVKVAIPQIYGHAKEIEWNSLNKWHSLEQAEEELQKAQQLVQQARESVESAKQEIHKAEQNAVPAKSKKGEPEKAAEEATPKVNSDGRKEAVLQMLGGQSETSYPTWGLRSFFLLSLLNKNHDLKQRQQLILSLARKVEQLSKLGGKFFGSTLPLQTIADLIQTTPVEELVGLDLTHLNDNGQKVKVQATEILSSVGMRQDEIDAVSRGRLQHVVTYQEGIRILCGAEGQVKSSDLMAIEDENLWLDMIQNCDGVNALIKEGEVTFNAITAIEPPELRQDVIFKSTALAKILRLEVATFKELIDEDGFEQVLDHADIYSRLMEELKVSLSDLTCFDPQFLNVLGNNITAFELLKEVGVTLSDFDKMSLERRIKILGKAYSLHGLRKEGIHLNEFLYGEGASSSKEGKENFHKLDNAPGLLWCVKECGLDFNGLQSKDSALANLIATHGNALASLLDKQAITLDELLALKNKNFVIANGVFFLEWTMTSPKHPTIEDMLKRVKTLEENNIKFDAMRALSFEDRRAFYENSFAVRFNDLLLQLSNAINSAPSKKKEEKKKPDRAFVGLTHQGVRHSRGVPIEKDSLGFTTLNDQFRAAFAFLEDEELLSRSAAEKEILLRHADEMEAYLNIKEVTVDTMWQILNIEDFQACEAILKDQKIVFMIDNDYIPVEYFIDLESVQFIKDNYIALISLLIRGFSFEAIQANDFRLLNVYCEERKQYTKAVQACGLDFINDVFKHSYEERVAIYGHLENLKAYHDQGTNVSIIKEILDVADLVKRDWILKIPELGQLFQKGKVSVEEIASIEHDADFMYVIGNVPLLHKLLGSDMSLAQVLETRRVNA